MAAGRGVPPHPDRGRAQRRRGREPGRVPLRRDRRAVPHDRQAPRRPPALGPGARAEPRLDDRRRHAPARRHQPPDDEQVRPLGQHAPHHRRGLRRRRRGSGQRHRAAVRQPARPARRVRPPDRPQHLAPAHRRVARRPRRRPGRWLVRRREAHRRPGPRRAGRSSAGSTTAPTWTPRSPRPVAKREAEIAKRKRPITGLTEFPNLGETLPERQPTDEWDDVRRYGASFEALRDEPAATPGLPGHARHRRPAHRPRDVRDQPARGRRHRRSTARGDARRASAVVVPRRHRRGVRRVRAPRPRPSCASSGAEWVIVAGKPRDWADDSCAMGVDALTS